jgi:hypothetical protein
VDPPNNKWGLQGFVDFLNIAKVVKNLKKLDINVFIHGKNMNILVSCSCCLNNKIYSLEFGFTLIRSKNRPLLGEQ